MTVSTNYRATLLCAALLTACGAHSDVRASTAQVAPVTADSPAHVSTVPGTTVPRGATLATTPPAAPPAVPRDTAHQPSSSAAVGGTLIKGRNAHDSTSFAGAIRAGQRLAANWPKGPTPIGTGVFPAKRIVAFYGTPLVKTMGILGKYPVDEMLAKLDTTVAAWAAADPSTPVQPALHLIAVVAQGSAGRDGKWRTRADTALINKVYAWAQRANALLFLDVQVGQSTLPEELPRLLPYLSRPNVHLGIDPEFSMHYEREGLPPGKKIGEMDAADVNYAIQTLAKVAADNNLPPKILIVHRFTTKMVTNVPQIHLDPHVQVVMDMDGLGPPWLKFDSYKAFVVQEPVQFTGFKLFYSQDTKGGEKLLTPGEVLQLVPRPMYIQYQ